MVLEKKFVLLFLQFLVTAAILVISAILSNSVQQASYLEGGPLLWILPLYLHVNKKSDDDDDLGFLT